MQDLKEKLVEIAMIRFPISGCVTDEVERGGRRLGRRKIERPDDGIFAVCRSAPNALVIATHLDSVNHPLLTGCDVRAYVQAHGLSQVRVPRKGETIAV